MSFEEEDQEYFSSEDYDCDECNYSKPKIFVKPPKWICKKKPLWQIYMKKFIDEAKRRADDERETYGEFYHMMQKDKNSLSLSQMEIPAMSKCLKLNLLNEKGKRYSESRMPRTRIWDDIRGFHKYNDCTPHPPPFEWPKIAPCLVRDVVKEKKIQERKLKMKKIGATPCEIEAIQSPESSEDEKLEELAHKKELIHARIPTTRVTSYDPVMIDRACGERIALVDGDCIVYELDCGEMNRSYANLCLRGMVGMHLEELQRVRARTWKFCLFQNIVALLVKTQLRYKYVWSANIDYIYDHAWKMFVYTGYLNTKPNQRFDDILVYNYMYDVEIQLVHEIKDIPIIRDVTFDYFEESLVKKEIIQRHKTTLMKCKFGSETIKDNLKVPVHKHTRRLEQWFDKLDDHYTNCILKTTRFSVAFWQDGLFWYLYNSYCCDKYGLWSDDGYASIMKFCTKDALKRHIMILIVRAYAYKLEDLDMCAREYNYFSVQIYQLIYHSCKIYNIKLYLRGPDKPKPHFVEKKKSDACLFEPYKELSSKPCDNSLESSIDQRAQEFVDKIEKPRWLQDMKIVWLNVTGSKSACKKRKWHEFEVLEPRRLYVLWSNIHITDELFDSENRNKQSRACYVVCAGMSLINAPEYWSADSLKAILIWGDRFYGKRREQISKLAKRHKNVDDDDDEDNSNDEDAWKEMPTDQFQIGAILFDVNVLMPKRGRLYSNMNQCLWHLLELLFQRHNFVILDCEDTNLGVFKHCGAYYIFDAYSRGPPVFKCGNGKAYLLRAACFRDLVSSLVLVIGSVECSPFSLRPIEIVNVVDTSKMDECSRWEIGNKVNCNYGAIKPKPACPGDKERRRLSKRGGKSPFSLDENKDKIKTICVLPKED
ncbi:PREDICTED: uncharacterized protein LOC105364245 [Ceratosolen solmsi marchali]|uniref:Uncharacterized protein LOC105364245 n=1 Tax=Ceratosolen solmsi marchali TaxID=326594 RepID=A0AAJ6YLS5_9HYME|nr:PREDICTED: uncharacterized protein LOC105364245 [Ceratosolen solmsi marchali]